MQHRRDPEWRPPPRPSRRQDIVERSGGAQLSRTRPPQPQRGHEPPAAAPGCFLHELWGRGWRSGDAERDGNYLGAAFREGTEGEGDTGAAAHEQEQAQAALAGRRRQLQQLARRATTAGGGPEAGACRPSLEVYVPCVRAPPSSVYDRRSMSNLSTNGSMESTYCLTLIVYIIIYSYVMSSSC